MITRKKFYDNTMASQISWYECKTYTEKQFVVKD